VKSLFKAMKKNEGKLAELRVVLPSLADVHKFVNELETKGKEANRQDGKRHVLCATNLIEMFFSQNEVS
jgi:hypothetical protein